MSLQFSNANQIPFFFWYSLWICLYLNTSNFIRIGKLQQLVELNVMEKTFVFLQQQNRPNGLF